MTADPQAEPKPENELAGVANPFRSQIVTDPWQQGLVDVPEIHGTTFVDCQHAVEQVRASGHSTSLLIHGEAGSGKTHLLGRLRHHLAPADADRTPMEPEPVFSWVRLNTSPRLIWQHLRRRFVDDILRPVAPQPMLVRCLMRHLCRMWPADHDIDRWWEYVRDVAADELLEFVDRLCDEKQVDHNLRVILRQVATGTLTREIRAWLRGDALPSELIAKLGLAEELEPDPEYTARQMVLALCRLLSPAPVVLTFDQVEALQIVADDTVGMHAFGALVSALHDETQNVVIISCVQSSFALLLQSRANGADYARMTDAGVRSLSGLNPDESRTLVLARLNSSSALSQLRKEQPEHPGRPTRTALWPLDESDLRVGALFLALPRALLAQCARRFDVLKAARSGEPEAVLPQTSHDEVIARYWQALCAQADEKNTQDKSEEILDAALPQLLAIVLKDWTPVSDPALPNVQFVYDTPPGRMGVAIACEASMGKLAPHLRNLCDQQQTGRLARLLVIRDPRLTITKTAKKAREFYSQLLDLAILVSPTVEMFSTLDALRTLLSDARSGDLANGADTIPVETVEAWLAAHLPESLRTLCDQIALPQPRETLTNLLQEQPVLPLTEAAHKLHCDVDQLLAMAEEYPLLFQLIGDPPMAIRRCLPEGAVG